MMSFICAMVAVMPPIDCTASLVDAWIAAICAEISSVALAVWLASAFTSEATTAKPRPDSPARAASMVALSASRLVCEAIEWISSHDFADLLGADRQRFDGLVGVLGVADRLAGDFARLRHLAGDLGDRGRQFLGGRRPPCRRWSTPDSDAAPTAAARALASLAVAVIDCAVLCISAAARGHRARRCR